MNKLENVPTWELEQELAQRQDKKVEYCPTCRGKWPIVVKAYQSWQPRPHCVGCNQLVENCRC